MANEMDGKVAASGRASVHPLTMLACAYLRSWALNQWNARLRLRSNPEQTLYPELFLAQGRCQAVDRRLEDLTPALLMCRSGDDVMFVVQSTCRAHLLEQDLGPWEPDVYDLLERTSRHRGGSLDALSELELFY